VCTSENHCHRIRRYHLSATRLLHRSLCTHRFAQARNNLEHLGI
jgi:hypothetical protein